MSDHGHSSTSVASPPSEARSARPRGLVICGTVALVVGAFLPWARIPGGSLSYLHITSWSGLLVSEQLGHVVSILLLVGAATIVANRADGWLAGGILYAGGWLLLLAWAAGVIPVWWSGLGDAIPSGVVMPLGALLLGMAGRRIHRAVPEPAEIRPFDPAVATRPGLASLLLLSGLALAVAFIVPSSGVGFAAVDPRHLLDLNTQTLWSTIELVIALRLILHASRAANEGQTSPFLAGAMLWMGTTFAVGPIGLSLWLVRHHIGIPATFFFAVIAGIVLLIAVRPLAQPTRRRGA